MKEREQEQRRKQIEKFLGLVCVITIAAACFASMMQLAVEIAK